MVFGDAAAFGGHPHLVVQLFTRIGALSQESVLLLDEVNSAEQSASAPCQSPTGKTKKPQCFRRRAEQRKTPAGIRGMEIISLC